MTPKLVPIFRAFGLWLFAISRLWKIAKSKELIANSFDESCEKEMSTL